MTKPARLAIKTVRHATLRECGVALRLLLLAAALYREGLPSPRHDRPHLLSHNHALEIVRPEQLKHDDRHLIVHA
jgi:hypothetical protein